MRRNGKLKLLALFTALAVASGILLSGCGKSETKANNADQKASTAESKSKGPVKIVGFVEGSGMPASKDQDVILKALNEKLGIDLEFNVVQSEYPNQLNVRIAGGNPPDFFSLNKEQMYTFARQGTLLELKSYIDKMPNVKKVFTDGEYKKGTVDGKLVALAKRPYIKLDSQWVRQDWLDKLGLKVPKTLDEFLAVSKAFAENDPDGNGKKDTYGYTGSNVADVNNIFGAFNVIYGAFGTTRNGQIYIKDNKLVYSTADPAFKDALAYINKLINTGSVDPEIVTNKNFADREKAFKGQAGMIHIAWTDFVKGQLADQMKAANPNAKWVQMEPLKGPGGQYAGDNDIGNAPGRYAIPKQLEKNSEKLEKVLKLFDYISDGEGHELVCYGLEGKHFKKENGKIIALPEMSEVAYSWNYQMTGRDDIPYYANKFPALESYVKFAAGLPRISTYNGFVSIPQGMNMQDLIKYEQEEVVKFMFGKRPLSEYDKFIEVLYCFREYYQYTRGISEGVYRKCISFKEKFLL